MGGPASIPNELSCVDLPPMCGITGIFAFNLIGKINKINVTAATMALSKRGPDFQDIYNDDWVALGHRRLSIIDTRDVANQPMWEESGRYAIVYNGEIFNFKELRKELEGAGETFRTASDTEVLLKLYVRNGEKCLEKLNGFFALGIYDKQAQTLLLARDRFGIKPLLYLHDEDKFIFASEMKSLLQYGIEKTIDKSALQLYLQLNYIPAPKTIFSNVRKLEPGHFIMVGRGKAEVKRWYSIPFDSDAAEKNPINYEDAKKQLAMLLEASVKRRLVSDVPLGAFLSGGVDSSIIAGLASRHQTDFHTFSIGFSDNSFFDETAYANLVAKHFGTRHTVFSLSTADMYAHVPNILDYIDEPFADSSAVAVYVLSKETRKHATVALSGDGADELFGGYNKHEAFTRVKDPGLADRLALGLAPIAKLLPQSRNSKFANKIRQIVRFAEIARLNDRERYIRLATFAKYEQAYALLHPDYRKEAPEKDFAYNWRDVALSIPEQATLNDILYTDARLVLPNDMLTKVDMMSMAHGLEVRVPYLDYELVNFAFTLPSSFKIGGGIRKRILQDAFRNFLPPKLYNRPKKGFEIPLLGWLRKEMKSLVEDDLLSHQFIDSQNIFNKHEIDKLKKQLYSSSPGDAHARIWGLVVFQWWWKKFAK
jgi:asparagine synthase (glutamine-hydrolysing)